MEFKPLTLDLIHKPDREGQYVTPFFVTAPETAEEVAHNKLVENGAYGRALNGAIWVGLDAYYEGQYVYSSYDYAAEAREPLWAWVDRHATDAGTPLPHETVWAKDNTVPGINYGDIPTVAAIQGQFSTSQAHLLIHAAFAQTLAPLTGMRCPLGLSGLTQRLFHSPCGWTVVSYCDHRSPTAIRAVVVDLRHVKFSALAYKSGTVRYHAQLIRRERSRRPTSAKPCGAVFSGPKIEDFSVRANLTGILKEAKNRLGVPGATAGRSVFQDGEWKIDLTMEPFSVLIKELGVSRSEKTIDLPGFDIK